MEGGDRVRSVLAIVGLVLLLVSAAPPEAEHFAEDLHVSEASVVVQPSWRPYAGLPVARELIVYVGGERRTVTQVQSLTGYDNWTIVIYVAARLTTPETLFRSALTLARATPTLVSHGSVELVVAHPRPRIVLAATRDAAQLRTALVTLARGLPEGSRGQFRPTSERLTPALVVRQVDSLLESLQDDCRSSTCLLLLVSDRFPWELAESPHCCRAQSWRLARKLAASRWLAGMVAIQETDLEAQPHDRPEHYQPVVREPNPVTQALLGTLRLFFSPGGGGAGFSRPALQFVTRVDAAAYTRIANQTAGFLALHERTFYGRLSALDRRLLVWFREPADPPNGIVPLRVVLAPRGHALQAPRWWRSTVAE